MNIEGVTIFVFLSALLIWPQTCTVENCAREEKRIMGEGDQGCPAPGSQTSLQEKSLFELKAHKGGPRVALIFPLSLSVCLSLLRNLQAATELSVDTPGGQGKVKSGTSTVQVVCIGKVGFFSFVQRPLAGQPLRGPVRSICPSDP